jgi:integrase
MARSLAHDMQYLELKNGSYWVTVAIPHALVSHFGKTRLKRNLGTDSLQIAKIRKLPVVAEFKAEIEAARGGSKHSPHVRRAVAIAEEIRLAEARGDAARINHLSVEVSETMDLLAGKPLYFEQDEFTGEDQPIYDESRAADASLFARIASGSATPLDLHHKTYLAQQDTKRRTKADDERALAYLLEWCTKNGIPQTVEAITKRRAAKFMDDLPTLGEKRSPVTLNKYLRRLSVYWQWLVKRDHAASNIWQGMILKEPQRRKDEQERPFTADEMKRLLDGPAPQALHDLMRIAALTGARLDAIVDLKVGDCGNDTFRFKPQKSETESRAVPIHSALVEVVSRRTKGKKPGEPIFPEWPAPKKADSQRERSFKASNAFTAYRRSVGVAEEVDGRRRSLVNFHSFRRWFITEAERAGIPESTIASVVGHKRTGMTFGVYSRGPSVEQLRVCVEAVKLPNKQGDNPVGLQS